MRGRPRIDPGSQARSRAAFERIVAAAQEMLDGRDWETITVEDLCIEAEVSPSSFYRRFRSKDDLLDEVHERWLAGRSAGAQMLVELVPWETAPLRDICRLIAKAYIADRDENAARSLSMFRMQVSYPRLGARRMTNDRNNLWLIVPPMAERIGRGHDETAFALLVIAHSIHAAVQPPATFIDQLDMTIDDLVERLVDAFAGMLHLDLDGDVRPGRSTAPLAS